MESADESTGADGGGGFKDLSRLVSIQHVTFAKKKREKKNVLL